MRTLQQYINESASDKFVNYDTERHIITYVPAADRARMKEWTKGLKLIDGNNKSNQKIRVEFWFRQQSIDVYLGDVNIGFGLKSEFDDYRKGITPYDLSPTMGTYKQNMNDLVNEAKIFVCRIFNDMKIYDFTLDDWDSVNESADIDYTGIKQFGRFLSKNELRMVVKFDPRYRTVEFLDKYDVLQFSAPLSDDTFSVDELMDADMGDDGDDRLLTDCIELFKKFNITMWFDKQENICYISTKNVADVAIPMFKGANSSFVIGKLFKKAK